MTVILPEHYHARQALLEKRVVCIRKTEALKQDIRALRIGILNLMPKAETYEFSLIFPLGRSILQIDPVWIKLETHHYNSSDKAHLKGLYSSFKEAIRDKHLDGLIVTGAPVGKLRFEDILYWEEIQKILDYARRNIPSTLGICWGGLAIARMLGIEKMNHKKKLFGVFEGENMDRNHRITGELDDVFFCPHSRYFGISDETMETERDKGNIRLLAKGKDVGYFIFESSDGRYIAHLGHPEYDTKRIIYEAGRDQKEKVPDVEPPVNFDVNNPINRWRGHRTEFFTQWIKYVYQQTDY
jgi:homoserine O-succinyltransferase